jgi:hypothetical protein
VVKLRIYKVVVRYAGLEPTSPYSGRSSVRPFIAFATSQHHNNPHTGNFIHRNCHSVVTKVPLLNKKIMISCYTFSLILITLSLSQTMTQYGKPDYWNDRYTRYSHSLNHSPHILIYSFILIVSCITSFLSLACSESAAPCLSTDCTLY